MCTIQLFGSSIRGHVLFNLAHLLSEPHYRNWTYTRKFLCLSFEFTLWKCTVVRQLWGRKVREAQGSPLSQQKRNPCESILPETSGPTINWVLSALWCEEQVTQNINCPISPEKIVCSWLIFQDSAAKTVPKAQCIYDGIASVSNTVI